MNTEYPHLGLMLVNDFKIVFTSYLLDHKERLKRFQRNPILTIFEGTVSESRNIQNISSIVIDPDQKIFYITDATLSHKGDRLYITTMFEGKDGKPCISLRILEEEKKLPKVVQIFLKSIF